MMKVFLPIFVSLFAAQVSMAQENLAFEETIADTIPIELTEHNNIAIRAIINEVDSLVLMLHTAVNNVSLTEQATAKMRSMKFSAADSVESWGGGGESRYSANNTLEIASFHWEDIGIWESKYSGHNTDGKFGLDLFGDKIIELNFEKSYLVIHSRLPKEIDGYTQVPILNQNGFMFIEGKCEIDGEVLSNNFLIHSGYSGSLLLDDGFVAQHNIGQKVETVDESILKDSYGNELKTIHAILPSFQLGDLAFSNVPVGFFEGAINRQRMSVLGGEILKRFHIFFDKKGESLYLRPNQLSGMPFAKK